MTTQKSLGKRLLILGNGMGSLFSAMTMSHFFSETLIIDKDEIPNEPKHRPGVPQGSHIHALLRRPLDIACEHLPGFEDDLVEAGGHSLRVGMDSRFHDQGDWQPQRDLAFNIAAQSRPLLEHVLRTRTFELPNIELRDQTHFEDYVFDGDTVVGVTVKTPENEIETIEADFVIDSTGRQGKTIELLKAHGYEEPPATEIGVNIGYTSAYFSRSGGNSEEAPTGAIIRSVAPRVKSGVIWPVEDDRWIISLSGRFGEFPPGDDEGFLDFAKNLEDPHLYDSIKDEKRVSKFTRFVIPKSYWRHYEKMEMFPKRMIPIGDTVSGFNPVYGQGMAVAAGHANALFEILKKVAAGQLTLDDVSHVARQSISEVTSAAWSMNEPVDLAFEKTTGVRPEGFEERIQMSKWTRKIIIDHPELHKIFALVTNLVEPPEAAIQKVIDLGLVPDFASEQEGADA